MATRVLMIAAENDALQPVDGRGGKVGGIGDVVRDIPPALAEEGCDVTVVVPSYGFLHRAPRSRLLGKVPLVPGEAVDLYRVPGKKPRRKVRQLIVDHPSFVSRDEDGQLEIYHHDSTWTPFAADATKFAFFCRAVAAALKAEAIPRPDVLHLHDWHAAFLLLLRQYDRQFSFLKQIPAVFSIHNLGLQGIRPLRGDPSSLEHWYPGLPYKLDVVTDPRWPQCVNPMAVGIRLADKVHTVSPTYAREILKPSNHDQAVYGAEGLEGDLAAHKKKLVGILNGLDYGTTGSGKKLAWPDLVADLADQVLAWTGEQRSLSARHFLAHARLQEARHRGEPPAVVLTSVTRVTEQKIRLLCEPTGKSRAASRPALEQILDLLAKDNGVYILMGTGEAKYEDLLSKVAGRHRNFLFLNGFSPRCAETLYATGHLFLMPSVYEPCGISQMLAMKEGQPCLVHAVGGLKDTIVDGEDGFAFTGRTVAAKARNFVERCRDALELRRRHPGHWREIRRRAAAKRFRWRDAAERYVRELYTP